MTTPPAPDTRPRCGAQVDSFTCNLPYDHDGNHGDVRPSGGGVWWPRVFITAQPAPTPSGDGAHPFTVKAQAVANDSGAFLAMHFSAMPVYAISESDGVKGHDLAVTWAKEPADRIVKAFTDAAALQEAREAASREGRERKVLQEEMVFEQQRAMAAEARLREVEGALGEVRKWVQYSAWHTASCPKKQDETVTCECGWAAIVAERLAAMAAAPPETPKG